jgi:hypothetical protein
MKPLKMVLWYSWENSKRKTGGSPVFQHGPFELSIDPSENSLDNTFKSMFDKSHVDQKGKNVLSRYSGYSHSKVPLFPS